MPTNATLPVRVELDGAANVRDLGGYRTGDGRRVRGGLLFRADSLHRVTAADVERLRQLGIRTVIDLRSAGEIDRSGPSVSEALGATYLHLEISHSRRRGVTPSPGELGDAGLAEVYRRYLSLNGDELATALRTMARPGACPILFHCFAGKDRTGVVAALVLGLVGVDDETIAADYAATSASFDRFLELVGTDEPAILDLGAIEDVDPSLLGARAETMLGLLAEVRQQAGSLEALVARWGIGVDVVTDLRANLLT